MCLIAKDFPYYKIFPKILSLNLLRTAAFSV